MLFRLLLLFEVAFDCGDSQAGLTAALGILFAGFGVLLLPAAVNGSVWPVIDFGM